MKSNISNLLIGNGLNHNGFSSQLIGKHRLRDSDKDNVPDIFDCVPDDPTRDAPIIPKALQPKTPPKLIKPPTLKEQEIIKTYGSIEAYRQKQQTTQSQALKQNIEETIRKINAGQITSLSQIPEEQRKYINVSGEYFQKASQYRQDLRTYQEQKFDYESAKQVLDKGGLGYRDLNKRARKLYQRMNAHESAMRVESQLAKRSAELGMSIAPEYMDKPVSDFEKLKALSTGKPDPRLFQKGTPKQIKPQFEQLSKTYKEQGFSKIESQYLAQESIKQKQSLSPQASRELIETKRYQDLKGRTKLQKQDGYSNITRGYDQSTILVDSGELDRDTSGSWWGRFTSRIKENAPQQESYSPGIGGFVSASPEVPDVSRSTSYIRPPTSKELKAIEIAQERGSFGSVFSFGVEGSKRVGKTFSRGASEVAGFVGEIPVPVRSRDYNQKHYYEDKYGNLQKKKFLTVGGLLMGARQTIDLTAQQSAKGYKKITERISEQTGLPLERTIPKKEYPIYQRSTIMGLGTGEEKTQFSITIPERKEKTSLGAIPELVEKSPTALYFLPQTFAGMLIGDIGTSSEKIKGLEGSKYSKEEQAKLKKEYESRIGLSSAFLLGAGGYKSYKGLTKPELKITAFEPLGKKETKFVEFVQPIQTEEGISSISNFKISQTIPGYRAKVKLTSPFREAFGFEPKRNIFIVETPKTKIIEPFAQKSFIGDRPFVSRTAKVRKTGELGEPKYSVISGRQKKLPVEEILSGGKIQEYQLKELIGAKTGVPVKKERIKDLIGEKEFLSMGEMETISIGKSIGKTTTKQQTMSLIKPKKDIEGLKIFDVITSTKDVTKPFSRASGKIDIMTGRVIQLPIKDISRESVTMMKSVSPKRTPIQSFQLTELQSTKAFSTLKRPKPKKWKDVISKVEQELGIENLPSMVGGRGLKQIPYSGKGLYEVTETSIGKQPMMTRDLMDIKTIQQQKDLVKLDIATKQEQEIQTKHKTIPKFDILKKHKTIDVQKITQPTALFLSTSPKTKPKQASGLSIPLAPLIKKPKPETTGFKGGFFFPGEKPTYKKEQPYDAYVLKDATKKTRRYEKINKEPLTHKSALSKMTKEVDRTISARGKVSKTKPIIKKGKKIPQLAKDTKDDYYPRNKQKFREWKTKKKTPLPSGVIIERQKYRLDSPGETRKIQKEKRKSQNVRRFFGF